MIRCEILCFIAACVVLINLCTVSPAPRAQFNGQIQGNFPLLYVLVAPSRPQSPYKDGQREGPDGNSELFAFPADPSMIESMHNARNRTPVYIPNKCQKNEILYPGDQERDWVCDCKPTYVYHPPTRQCYEMYTQGYCENGTMIYLAPKAKHPDCIPNQCYNPRYPNGSLVFYNGSCVLLNEYHPSCNIGQLRQVVGINETTHELGCLNISGVKVKELMGSTGSQSSLDRS
ncbi:uncharacterized protein LOC131695417 isoform X1 [Topomyia yanbarensis]|uniref:uncharacterized protein LOC131695417 isoform X1 n=1 Tax=Topomyia yanbarensis TaxID=2498891 RepID=UPI00273A8103|nr:uncharacterized protein LOC131695417 isoform X1 [Topomyia yanbarensis]